MLQVAAGDTEDRTREELKDAELVAFDAELDLAVLKVADFDQPVAKISKDENVPTGDAIRVLGYPGRGNMADDVTLTVTDGIVSGTLKDEFGNQFIKTDTALAPGNSGGSAFAVGGELIGVPTSVSYIECAEAGCAGASFGFIRPIRYAIPLIEQAKDAAVIPLSDLPTEDEGSTTTEPADPSDGGAPIANERFGGVDSDQNEVETPDGTIAAGDTSGACIWFDYEGPATGSLDYSVRLDGEEVSTDSQDVSENPNGFCVSTSGSVPVGEYEISAVLSGEPDTEVVVVGTVT